MPGSQRPHTDLADLARRQRIVLVADDLQFREPARPAGRGALGLGIVGREHGDGEGLGHRVERRDLDAEAVWTRRDRTRATAARSWPGARDARDRAAKAARCSRMLVIAPSELNWVAPVALISSQKRAGREARRDRERAIGPQRRIGRSTRARCRGTAAGRCTARRRGDSRNSAPASGRRRAPANAG